MEKKLYKSSTDKMLCGVLGGLGQYFGIDSTLVRLVFTIGAFCTAVVPAIIIYIICAIIIPDAPYTVE